MTTSAPPTERILGINFFNGTTGAAVDFIIAHRGYTVVPAAPALATITHDPDYAAALSNSDLAIADSGFMVLLWRMLKLRSVPRISGLRYLQDFLGRPEIWRGGSVFFILPSDAAREKASRWFQQTRRPFGPENSYVAPFYGPAVADPQLVERLKMRRPDHVIVAIGGGTQEKLGYYLRENLDYRPAIHCIGAALGFLTGDQKPIPLWADRLYLGWFLRLLRNPRLYGRRYSRAFVLPWLIFRYGREMPPLKQ